jgi:hypothetical protein
MKRKSRRLETRVPAKCLPVCVLKEEIARQATLDGAVLYGRYRLCKKVCFFAQSFIRPAIEAEPLIQMDSF